MHNSHGRQHGHGTHGLGFALIPILPGGKFFLFLFVLVIMCGGS